MRLRTEISRQKQKACPEGATAGQAFDLQQTRSMTGGGKHVSAVVRMQIEPIGSKRLIVAIRVKKPLPISSSVLHMGEGGSRETVPFTVRFRDG